LPSRVQTRGGFLIRALQILVYLTQLNTAHSNELGPFKWGDMRRAKLGEVLWEVVLTPPLL